MPFRTKLDYSDNRQIKQNEKTNTILSGGTTFGLPFSALTSGPDLSSVQQISQYIGVISDFSGNSMSTEFDWSTPIDVSVIDSSITPIIPSNSGVTQSVDIVFNPSSSTLIDGNLVNLSYSGVEVDNLYVISMVETTPGNYTGQVSSDFYIFSADTLDFTGRTIWVDNTEILRTDRLIVSRGAQVGYVLGAINSEGMCGWVPNSGSTSGDTFTTGATLNGNTIEFDRNDTLSAYTVDLTSIVYWTSGSTGIFSIKAINETGLDATGDYAHAEGDKTLASGTASHAEGGNTTASGFASHAEGNNTTASGFASHAQGNGTIASGDYSFSSGVFTKAYGNSSFIGGSGYDSTNNIIVSGDSSFVFYGRSTNSGPLETGVKSDFSVILGGVNHETIDALESGIFVGSNNKILNTISRCEKSAIIAGANNILDNYPNSVLLGGGNNNLGSPSSSIIGGFNHVIDSNGGNNSIIGGNNCLLSATTNSIILGCLGLSATTSNTVYVPDLVIDGLTSQDPIATDANGKIVAGTSDIRLKKNIIDLSSPLDVVKNLRGVAFEYTEESNMGPGLRYGFIAQEVQDIIPEIVKLRAKGDGMLSLNYSEIIPWLVEAIKEITSPNYTHENYILQTQTISAEDNFIELNYNGTHQTSLGGGLIIIKGLSNEEDVYFKLNENKYWSTNTYISPYGLIIPSYAPTGSNDDKGVVGEITRDDNYLYVKTTSGWKRSSLESF